MAALVALKPQRYAGLALKTGDQFEASRKDARVLIAIGRARRAVREFAVAIEVAPVSEVEQVAEVAPAVEQDPPYDFAFVESVVSGAEQHQGTESATDVMDEQEPEPVVDSPAEPVKAKRAYKRRDMVAESQAE